MLLPYLSDQFGIFWLGVLSISISALVMVSKPLISLLMKSSAHNKNK
jgi:hypothetical protein